MGQVISGGGWARILGAAGVGSLVGLCWNWMDAAHLGQRSALGPRTTWVCDRDAGRITCLDSDLLCVEERRVPYPVEVAGRHAAPELWVLCAAGPGQGAGRTLRLLGPVGTLPPELGFAAAWALKVTRAGAARFLARIDGQTSLLEVDPQGVSRVLRTAEGVQTWGDMDPGIVLLGRRRVSVFVEHRWSGELCLSGDLDLLASAVREGRLWLLLRRGDELHIRVLDSKLRALQAIELGAWTGEPEGRWNLVSWGPGAYCIVSPSGRVRWQAQRNQRAVWAQLQAPVCGVLATGAGVVMVASPSGIQRLGRDGQPLPGQGGFRFLTAASGLEMLEGRDKKKSRVKFIDAGP